VHQTVIHHPDYRKPLNVWWLCKECHTQVHAEFKRKGRKPKQTPAKDLDERGYNRHADTSRAMNRQPPKKKDVQATQPKNWFIQKRDGSIRLCQLGRTPAEAIVAWYRQEGYTESQVRLTEDLWQVLFASQELARKLGGVHEFTAVRVPKKYHCTPGPVPGHEHKEKE